MAELEYDYSVRVIIVGDWSSGKSCLFNRYESGVFLPLYANLMRVSFVMKTEHFKEFVVRLLVWDTDGTERCGQLPSFYYEKKEIILIVFDLSNKETFKHVDKWFINAKKHAAKKTNFLLIGNKNDLPREVSDEEARQKAEQWSVGYIEASAVTGENVNSIFRSITEEAVLGIRRNYEKISEKH